jgi:hypothetical protein
MKLSAEQERIFGLVEAGLPVSRAQRLEAQAAKDRGDDVQPLQVTRAEWSKDGANAIICTRTVKKFDTGDTRKDYMVEMFRVTKTGEVTRI